MPITTTGRDLWANALSNGNNGASGTALAGATATVLKASGSPGWTTNQFAGQDVYVASATPVVGTVVSNNASELTVVRWETPSSRGGAVATTPSGTPVFFIASGATPALWMALSWNSGFTESAGAEAKKFEKEITTAGGGLIRQFAIFAHTAASGASSSNTYTITQTFTANGTDVLSGGQGTIYGIGVYNCNFVAGEPVGQRLLFMTKLASTATLSSSGDSVAITDTVTGS